MYNSMQHRSIPNNGAANSIKEIEERTRLQNAQNKFATQYGLNSQTPTSSRKDEAPGISTVSSQDSSKTSNSVASRRQRIMALSAKNRAAQRRSTGNPKSPKNDADKPPSWQTKKASGFTPPAPIDTSNAMGGYDGKEQSSCVEAPTPPSNKSGISNRVNSFQRDCGRESPPPPPPPAMPETQISESQPTDAEPVNKFKHWSEREQKERSNRVVAYPSHSPWKGKVDKVDAPSPSAQSPRRIVVPPSPTGSVGSVGSSSFSGYQPKPPSSARSWNSNNRSFGGTAAGKSPQVPRNFASPKYGSPQPRYSTGSRPSIESYKNNLKPIRKETEPEKSNEKEAYGATIETPKKASVSSLHAMFDSQKSTPLMPMNSTNSSVRHSLPLRSPSTPTSVKPAVNRYQSPGRGRFSFDEQDDRSVASARSARSASSVNRPVPPVVASWNQRQQAEKIEKKEEKSRLGQHYSASWRMQSPKTTEDSPKPSWQQRCKPRPIEVDAPDSPTRSTNAEVEPSRVNAQKSVGRNAPSQFAIASMMFSQNVNAHEEKQNSLRAAMDWPSATNEKPAPTDSEVGDSLTDVILDSITDVGTNDLELPSMLGNRPEEPTRSVARTSSGLKPWENDTKHSVVQSWQMRSSRSGSISATESSEQPSDKNETEDVPVTASNNGDTAAEEKKEETAVGEIADDSKYQPEIVPTNSSADSLFLDEKKSGDLSFDEDQILGESTDGRSMPEKDNGSTQHVESNHPRREPFYDDDSYLSRGDTASRGLAPSESMRTKSDRSRTIGTYNSEDMSVYVEDESLLSKNEDKILTAQLEQMNLEVAVGESESKSEVEEVKNPQLMVDVAPPAKPNLPRLNPSPKDCDTYRSRYFEDSGGVRSRSGRATPVGSVQSRRSTEKQIIDIWATTSQEERDEAISFDETDRWLDCDPDVMADDVSESSEPEMANEPVQPVPTPEPRPIVIRKPRDAYVTPEKQRQRAKAMTSSAKKETPKETPKQDVFDPFGDDAEEGGLTVEISDDLFASNPDPFMTAESFSPLEWSGSPRESNTRPNNSASQSQHIGYYNSPDSRFEI